MFTKILRPFIKSNLKLMRNRLALHLSIEKVFRFWFFVPHLFSFGGFSAAFQNSAMEHSHRNGQRASKH
jgi:hypothetical protein